MEASEKCLEAQGKEQLTERREKKREKRKWKTKEKFVSEKT